MHVYTQIVYSGFVTSTEVFSEAQFNALNGTADKISSRLEPRT